MLIAMKQLIFGILFIVLGASGEFTLRGTNSPGLLIIVGVILTLVGVMGLLSSPTKKETEKEPELLTEKQKMYNICRSCTSTKFDKKTGINCGLTGSKPNFREMCPSYTPKLK